MKMVSKLKNTFFLLLSLLFFAACNKAPLRPSIYTETVIKNYEIGIAPSHLTVPPDSLFTQTEAWKEVKDAVDFYKFYGLQIIEGGDVWRTRLAPSLLTEFASTEAIEIGCETGSFHLGGRKAETLTDLQLQPIVEAGGKIASIHLDGPVRRMIKGIQKHPKAMTLKKVVERLTLFWQNTRQKYPETEIGLIVNLPNWDYTRELHGYIGLFSDSSGYTYREVLDTLYAAITDAGEKIAFVEVDCPYNFFIQKRTLRNDATVDNGAKLRALSAWCWQRDIKFHVIVNSMAAKNSAKIFHDNVMQYLIALRKENVFPDKFLFQSWYKYPAENLPESKRYTFMNTVRDGIILLRALYPQPGG